MIETFTALLFAHALADFVLQTNWINRNKAHAGVMLLHGAIVLAVSLLSVGHWFAGPVLALAVSHLVIDCIKTYGKFRGFAAFAADQGAHLATLAVVAALAPTLWSDGQWSGSPSLLPFMAVGAGLILTLRAGQYAVGLIMHPHTSRMRLRGLKEGGRQIGLLERGLIFLFVLGGQPVAVGFLIAAKSILRFGTATRDQATAEYVIIGTLASFGWAFLIAEATRAMLSVLPPLEIAPVLA
ncbi:MAG: DUF3307 domain-containing protein [Pseudomonadota bacterium]